MKEKAIQQQNILEQWLSFNPAASSSDDRVVVKTSEEIVSELSEIAQLEINEVALFLTNAGYRLAYHQGKFGWAFKPMANTETF